MNNLSHKNDSASNTRTQNTLSFFMHRELKTNLEQGQRQLAAKLSPSLGGANYALKVLIERGFAKTDNFRKSGSKEGCFFVPISHGVAERTSLVTAFLDRKLQKAELLREKIDTLGGGRSLRATGGAGFESQ